MFCSLESWGIEYHLFWCTISHILIKKLLKYNRKPQKFTFNSTGALTRALVLEIVEDVTLLATALCKTR